MTVGNTGLFGGNRDLVKCLAGKARIPADVATEPVFPTFKGFLIPGVHALPVTFGVVPPAIHAGALMNRGGSLEDAAGALPWQFDRIIRISHFAHHQQESRDE